MRTLKIAIHTVVLLVIVSFTSWSQSISPAPRIVTVCPGELVNYVLNPNPNFSGCSNFTWTLSNGSFNFGSSVTTKTTTTNSVDVFWNDIASNGTLTVTASCTSGGTLSTSFTYAIRSLKDRVPSNIRSSSVLPYCSTSSMILAVDVMFLENTGGTSGILQQRADGYEWTLPAGWSSNGSTGTFRTTTESISIVPDNGCRQGSASVKAYVSSCNSGFKYSGSASISLNRPSPSISIAPAAGYSGAACGNVQPVTFTVTPVSCATNYLWVFPSGWLQTPVYTTSNSITVTPSGGALDAGNVQVTVNLECGTQLASSPYRVNFTAPVISVPSSTVCSGGTSIALLNVGSGIAVTWSPSANISLVSGQGTSVAVVKALTTSTSGAGTINATVSCPNTTVSPSSVWVGSPTATGLDLAVMFGPSSNLLCWDVKLGIGVINSNHSTHRVTDYVWNFSTFSPYFVGYDIGFPYGSHGIAEFKVNSTAPTTSRLMSVKAQNTCGYSAQYWEGFTATNCQGGPGGMGRVSTKEITEEASEVEATSVYPVPANDKLMVELKTTKEITSVILYNSSSIKVFETNSTESKLSIPVGNFPGGLYYLVITSGNESEKQRVLIQH